MEPPRSMSMTQKVLFYSNKLCELIDERVDKYLEQVELRKRIVLLENERSGLNKKINLVSKRLNKTVRYWNIDNKNKYDKKEDKTKTS